MDANDWEKEQGLCVNCRYWQGQHSFKTAMCNLHSETTAHDHKCKDQEPRVRRKLKY